MPDWIIAQEPWLRLSFFFGMLLAMAAWERLAPRRHAIAARGRRWVSHLGISVVNTAAIRLLLPGTAVVMALFAEAQG